MDELLAFFAGEYEHLGLRQRAFDLPGGFEAVELGHSDVEHDHVGRELFGERHRFPPIAGFSADFPAGLFFDQEADAMPDDFVIVGEKDAKCFHANRLKRNRGSDVFRRAEKATLIRGTGGSCALAPERTVLYIEDDPANAKLVRLIMALRPRIKLLGADAGRPGVALAQKCRPSLVLLDFHLPGMNGEQVLERLRDDPRTADIPVVMLSGDASPAQIERLLGLGVQRYVTKPFNVRDLLDSVDALLCPAVA